MMLSDTPFSFLTSPVGLFFAITLPSLLALAFTLIILAGISSQGAKASRVGAATFHYIMQAVGVILMTIGSLPTLVSVLSGVAYSGRLYMSLLWVFLVGGALFLWHEQRAHLIDKASTAVPHAIFISVIRTMGYLTALFSALTFLVIEALGSSWAHWWVSPLVLFLYGTLLYWSSLEPPHGESAFENTPLHSVVKAVSAKKVKVKKNKWGFLHLFGKRA